MIEIDGCFMGEGIEPENMHILYHANCCDGFGAAWVLSRAMQLRCGEDFAARVHYTPVSYNEPVPEIPDGAVVVIVDFSYKRLVLEALARRCRVLVLDHHKTAEEELRGGIEGACVVFDMQHSGASLALEVLGQNIRATHKRFVDYLRDRDLWLHAEPDTHAVNIAIRYAARTFEEWDYLNNLMTWSLDVLTVRGQGLLAMREEIVRGLCAHACLWDLGHGPVPVVNTSPDFASDVCNELLRLHPAAPYAMTWSVGKSGAGGSLRSRPDFDVSVLARHHGGGGHRQAAGFGLSEEASRSLVEAVRARMIFAGTP